MQQEVTPARMELINELKAALYNPMLAKYPPCSFAQLDNEEKEELRQQYKDRNGILLTPQELERHYRDTTFLKGLLLEDAAKRKAGKRL